MKRFLGTAHVLPVITERGVQNVILFAIVVLLVIGAAFPAAARTTATYGQNAVGQPCGSLANGSDFDALFQCTSSASGTSGIQQTAPIILGTVTAPPYAATTCDTNKAGMIQWTGSAFQGCDGSSWVALGGSTACATPAAFSFTDQTGVALNTSITSNTVTLSGASFTCSAMATCTGCTNIIRNGVANGTSAIFNSGDTIALQLTSSTSPNTAKTAAVTVGNTTSGTWTVTTSSNSPNAFAFTDQTGVNTSATITSNTVTLSGAFSGLTATCGTGCTAISRNGAAFSTAAVSGFQTGDTIAIQQTSASTSTTSSTASVTIGGTTSSTWTVTTSTDPCVGTPSTGTVCADGTLYAGLSPDGNVKMYTSRCDVGQVWDGSSCTGTRTTKKWAYANTINTGVTNATSGETNTDNLYALNGTNADSPYEAATFCHDLSQNGRDDWYLPSSGEINVLYTAKTALANFDTSGTYYWSSTEYSYNGAWYQRFSDGFQYYYTKYNFYLVRCVRR